MSEQELEDINNQICEHEDSISTLQSDISTNETKIEQIEELQREYNHLIETFNNAHTNKNTQLNNLLNVETTGKLASVSRCHFAIYRSINVTLRYLNMVTRAEEYRQQIENKYNELLCTNETLNQQLTTCQSDLEGMYRTRTELSQELEEENNEE